MLQTLNSRWLLLTVFMWRQEKDSQQSEQWCVCSPQFWLQPKVFLLELSSLKPSVPAFLKRPNIHTAILKRRKWETKNKHKNLFLRKDSTIDQVPVRWSSSGDQDTKPDFSGIRGFQRQISSVLIACIPRQLVSLPFPCIGVPSTPARI